MANDAKDFIDSTLLEKYHITGLRTEGSCVFISTVDNPSKKSDYKEAGKIMALSTFYIMKGVALNKKGTVDKKVDKDVSKRLINKHLKKYSTIILDELNQERSEKKTFDISYSFVNTLETVCRNDTDRRIILSGNTLEEGSDILSNCFNFIPNKFGTYFLKNKQCVIDYIEDSDKFKTARKSSIAGILAPTESTFTNKIESDVDLIVGKTKKKQSYIIRFDKGIEFVVCEGNIITKQKYNIYSDLNVIAMEPYIVGIPYDKEKAAAIIEAVQKRYYKFDMLITLKQFYTQIKLLKQR